MEVLDFKLQEGFLQKYKSTTPPFGFNGLGELVYKRTYSRIMENGEKEEWWQTVRRVVEGCYRVQKTHIINHMLGWDEKKAHRSAEEMYDLMFNLKLLPPGRGLWIGNTDHLWKTGSAALNNCAFISTKDIDIEPTLPFEFIMDMSMVGVGVGFDTKGEGQLEITFPETACKEPWLIPDTREGWVDSVARLLRTFFEGAEVPDFDYSDIRGAGEIIKGFGGVSAGPEPLKLLHKHIFETLVDRIGYSITARDIVDIANRIGCCVVAGNVRRTALIVIGRADDEFYLDLKNYNINPERAEFGWSSNNSVEASVGMDFSECAKRTEVNGEPGYIFLENARSWGRTGDRSNSEPLIMGFNPCGEQSLESGELCNLVEIFLNNVANKHEFERCCKYAYLYAKTVTLIPTHWALTNRIMLRNRRIGTSLSGVVQFKTKYGMDTLKEWCTFGYDKLRYYDDVYSNWLCIPRSVKITTVKPSGTISLLSGATPGVHYPINRYYIRRVRIAKDSELVPMLINSGYKVEPAVYQEDTTVVVEFPVDCGEGIRAEHSVSIWEQTEMVAFMQKYWSDNAVSNTITFDKEKEGSDIENVLSMYQFKVKSLSFLPRSKDTYPQMPYEAISRDQYNKLIRNIRPMESVALTADAVGEKFCDGESCTL